MSDNAPAPQNIKKYTVKPEGSLGLLALGYRGVMAWRALKAAHQKQEHER